MKMLCTCMRLQCVAAETRGKRAGRRQRKCDAQKSRETGENMSCLFALVVHTRALGLQLWARSRHLRAWHQKARGLWQ